MESVAPFGDCKAAVLQNIPFIQGSGVLIGVDVPTQLITVCSDNLFMVMGESPESVLGKAAVQVFGKQWDQLVRLASEEGRHQVSEIVLDGEQLLTVVGHRRGDLLLFEIKPGSQRMLPWWNHAARTAFLDHLAMARSVEQCVALLVDTVFQRSGLDHVMCYRFLPDWDGEVIHEACRPGIDGFLGLRFPATDIPANARHLFTLNWYRLIADIDEKNVPLRIWADDGAGPDLTYSTLRAVHPAHIQYLRNMGVQASLSLSLLVNGKLWGLLACHHLTQITLNIHDLFAFEEIAKLVSLHMRNLLGIIDHERQSTLRENLSLVRGALQACSDKPKNAFALVLGHIRDSFRASGIWLHFENEDHFVGLTPELQALAPLRHWLDLMPKETISQYDELPETLVRHPAIGRHASAVLYIPLGSSDYLVLMRQEVVHVVKWAGQSASLDDSGSLAPRHSFAVYVQKMRNRAEPWHDSEIGCADTLRKNLIDYINMARLEKIALHDTLTGLANRLQFDKRMSLEVQNALSHGGQFAVHMIDLDKFKPVNDTFGHGAGDDLLKAVSNRLLQLVRVQDTVARLGGDEFAIIQSGVSGRKSVSSMAERIVQALAKPFEIRGATVEIGTSVGVALFPEDSLDQSDLLHKADIALYAVKKAGRNAFSLFTDIMCSDEAGGGEMDANALLEAMERDQLELFYQPIVDACNGELHGLESFVRWHHPKKGLLSAEQFMPRIDQIDVGLTLGRWVLDAIFKQYRQWRAIGLPSYPITVNISSVQLVSQDLIGDISERAKRYDTGLEWLRLDIKEDAILMDVNHAIRKLTALREHGVAAQLDNFGKGFISLGFMSQLPFIGVKVDASAMQQPGDTNGNAVVLNVVKGIAKVLNAKLTITRVENKDAAAWLRKHEVDLLQGFGIGEPMPAAYIADWLDKGRNPQ